MLWVVAVTLQGTVSKSCLAQEHEEKMQNGGASCKRTGPSMKPKVKRRKDPAASDLRHSLDMCSKHANVMQALELYDKVVAEGALSFNQYSFNIVLYLCSSAATGVLKRGKSGNERTQQGLWLLPCRNLMLNSSITIGWSCQI